jgi:hypothetical protein
VHQKADRLAGFPQLESWGNRWDRSALQLHAACGAKWVGRQDQSAWDHDNAERRKNLSGGQDAIAN